MSAADERAIVRLIHRYAELVDNGDFTGVGELLAGATFVSTAESARYDGEWRFTRRRSEPRLVGDLSAHLIPAGS